MVSPYPSTKDRVELAMIIDDFRFFADFAVSIRMQDEVRKLAPRFLPGIVPLIAMYVFESSKHLPRLAGTEDITDSLKMKAEIASARNSMKLLDQGKRRDIRKIAGDIAKASESRGYALTCAMYRDRLLTTDHTALYLMGSKDGSMHNDMDGFGFELSKYIADHILELTPGYKVPRDMFFSTIPGRDLTTPLIRPKDFYSSRLNGFGTKENQVIISSCQALLNTIELLSNDSSARGDRNQNAAFKLCYIAIWTVAKTLKIMQEDASVESSKQKDIQKLLDRESLTISLLGNFEGQAREFRNVLMHYGVGGETISQMSLARQQPFGGLIPLCFPGLSFDSMNDFVRVEMREVSRVINGW